MPSTATTIKLEHKIFNILAAVIKDEKTARELSSSVVEIVAEGLEEIKEKAKEQKTVVKAEVKDELRKELVTKEEFYSEIKRLESEMKALEERLTKKMTIGFMTLAFLIIFLNQSSLQLILKVLGLLK